MKEGRKEGGKEEGRRKGGREDRRKTGKPWKTWILFLSCKNIFQMSLVLESFPWTLHPQIRGLAQFSAPKGYISPPKPLSCLIYALFLGFTELYSTGWHCLLNDCMKESLGYQISSKFIQQNLFLPIPLTLHSLLSPSLLPSPLFFLFSFLFPSFSLYISLSPPFLPQRYNNKMRQCVKMILRNGFWLLYPKGCLPIRCDSSTEYDCQKNVAAAKTLFSWAEPQANNQKSAMLICIVKSYVGVSGKMHLLEKVTRRPPVMQTLAQFWHSREMGLNTLWGPCDNWELDSPLSTHCISSTPATEYGFSWLVSKDLTSK